MKCIQLINVTYFMSPKEWPIKRFDRFMRNSSSHNFAIQFTHNPHPTCHICAVLPRALHIASAQMTNAISQHSWVAHSAPLNASPSTKRALHLPNAASCLITISAIIVHVQHILLCVFAHHSARVCSFIRRLPVYIVAIKYIHAR